MDNLLEFDIDVAETDDFDIQDCEDYDEEEEYDDIPVKSVRVRSYTPEQYWRLVHGKSIKDGKDEP